MTLISGQFNAERVGAYGGRNDKLDAVVYVLITPNINFSVGDVILLFSRNNYATCRKFKNKI